LCQLKNKAPDIRILTNRDQKGVLDSDFARVYGVTTKRLNEAVAGGGDSGKSAYGPRALDVPR